MCNVLFIDWQPTLEAFHIGGFGVRWYSLLWCVGLLAAYFIVQNLYKKQNISVEKFDPLFMYCFVGVLVGARLGHCLFYEPNYFLTSAKGFIEMFLPIKFAYNGWDWTFTGYTGLASHGGTIGLFLAILLYAKKNDIKLMTVLDNIAIATPIVAACIRLGNLMNSEIIGTPTTLPWGFIFHTRDALVDGQLAPRHPAQLYEALWYLLVFLIIYKVAHTKHDSTNIKSHTNIGSGFYFGFILTSIFLFRFFIEFLKTEQVDFEKNMILDMGQLLSIPFIIIGLFFIIRKPHNK